MNRRFLLITAGILFASPGYTQSNSFTLQQCKEMALEQNKKMKVAQLQVQAAKAVERSVAANAYPAFDGSVMGVYLGPPLAGAFNGMIPKEFVSGSVTASLPLYAGGRLRNGRTAAAKGVELSEEQKNVTSAQLLLDVEKAYWQVVQVKEKIVLAGKYEVLLQSLQKDLQNSFDAGLIYKNDLLKVMVSLNEAKLNNDRAKDGLVLAKLQLAQMTGNGSDTDFDVADTVSENVDIPEQLIDGKTADRPEIRMLSKALEAQQYQKKVLIGEQLPSLGISGSGLATGGQRINIKDGSDFMTTYYGIANISIPLFDWGKKSNKVKEQSLKIAAQKEQLEEMQELINLEIQQAYLQLSESAKRIGYAKLSLEQASENLRLAQDRLLAGTITGKDVLEAQAIWQQAYSSLIEAKIDYKVSQAAYRKSIGR